MNGRLSPPRGLHRGLGWSCEIAEVGVGYNIGDHTTVDHSIVGRNTVENFCLIVCGVVSAAIATVGVAAVAAKI